MMKEVVVDKAKARKVLAGPLYRLVDAQGRITLDKDLGGQEVLVMLAYPAKGDKSRYLRLNRRAGGEYDLFDPALKAKLEIIHQFGNTAVGNEYLVASFQGTPSEDDKNFFFRVVIPHLKEMIWSLWTLDYPDDDPFLENLPDDIYDELLSPMINGDDPFDEESCKKCIDAGLNWWMSIMKEVLPDTWGQAE
jgi:hypothetical protein